MVLLFKIMGISALTFLVVAFLCGCIDAFVDWFMGD